MIWKLVSPHEYEPPKQHTHCSPSRQPELLRPGELVHAHHVHLIPVRISQLIQLADESLVVLLDQHPAAPVLARDIRDDGPLLTVPAPRVSLEARKSNDIITDGLPPVHTPRKREWVRGRALGLEEVDTVHRCRAVREYDAVEHVYAVGVCALEPIVHELHDDGGKRGERDPLVHRGVILPVDGVDMCEEHTPEGWESCFAVRSDGGVERGVDAPEPEEELCRPMVVMCDAVLSLR